MISSMNTSKEVSRDSPDPARGTSIQLSMVVDISCHVGNILMLSEGRPGIDDKYILKDGMLKFHSRS